MYYSEKKCCSKSSWFLRQQLRLTTNLSNSHSGLSKWLGIWKMSINIEDVLGQPAILQILNKKRGRTEEEKRTLALKIEASCKRFNNNRGRLSIDEFYNVIKLQNGVEVSKDELRRLVADLEMDKQFKISIKVIKSFLTVARACSLKCFKLFLHKVKICLFICCRTLWRSP